MRLNFPPRPSEVLGHVNVQNPEKYRIGDIPERPPNPEELCDMTSRFTIPFPRPEISSPFVLIS